ncbi:MAG: hypothetical protein WC532_08630 [Candidatus Omnitrophota bacterium]
MKFVICAYFVICVFLSPVAAAEQQPEAQQAEQRPVEYIGEFFDIKVPRDNYVFIKSTHMVFGDQAGPAKTEEEKEQRIWDDLVLSYEAFRRGVTVAQEEIDEEVKKILEAEKVTFDFKVDKQAYAEWLKTKTNEPVELFENQLRHLIQMRKLKEQVMDQMNPEISDKEARQRFLDESSSLSIELAEFENKESAENFYKKARVDKKFWDEEKSRRPKEFRQPGFVTLAFLIDIWQFPRDAAYKMLKMKKGEIYGPAPVYKGYGVFKVLDNKTADEAEYPKVKENYYAKIRGVKKYEGLEQWIRDLKKQANIKIYNQIAEKGGEK